MDRKGNLNCTYNLPIDNLDSLFFQHRDKNKSMLWILFTFNMKHGWNSNLKVLSSLEYAQKLCFTYELSTHSTTHAPFRALEYFKNDITIFCSELSSYVLEIELQI